MIASAARDRGVAADVGTVLVSAGALQAIDLACRVYLRPGDVVVAESPAFANALSAFRNHGARVLEVPVDADGLDVAEASRRIRKLGVRPRMFFVVPNFQNPTGETLSLERREALLALAASHEAVVVEDDPYGALRFRGEDLPPLAALGGAEVVSIGTFSKTFLPGLRVGRVAAGVAATAGIAALFAAFVLTGGAGWIGERASGSANPGVSDATPVAAGVFPAPSAPRASARSRSGSFWSFTGAVEPKRTSDGCASSTARSRTEVAPRSPASLPGRASPGTIPRAAFTSGCACRGT